MSNLTPKIAIKDKKLQMTFVFDACQSSGNAKSIEIQKFHLMMVYINIYFKIL